MLKINPNELNLTDRVVHINRVAKVVKGGRRFQFRVTLIMGDNRGKVGMGVGKANAVPDAMRKASERARKNMHLVNLSGTTIPHEVLGKVAGARVMLIGGQPFTETILMWWNFVARTPEEIALAREDWEQHRRFGDVRAYPGPRLTAPNLVRFARPNPVS